MYACGISIVEQYKTYYSYHFHYRQLCYPCYFIFSSELELDMSGVRLHVAIDHQPLTVLEQWKTFSLSQRCLEAFHYSSAMSGWWAIKPCLFECHSPKSL